MATLVDSSGQIYEIVTFAREDDFEKCVVTLADRIFGPSTIYIDVKKRMHGGGIISIPDGYVLDLSESKNPRFYVVENEIVSHDPFKHIGIGSGGREFEPVPHEDAEACCSCLGLRVRDEPRHYAGRLCLHPRDKVRVVISRHGS